MFRRCVTCTKLLYRCYYTPSPMKALVLNNYADTVAELDTQNEFPAPQPLQLKDSQALIKVHASSVNPIDIEMTRGFASTSVNFLRLVGRFKEFPLILGRDFSGVVVARGKKFPQRHQEGDEVYGVRWILGHGTHAEYAVVNPYEVVKKPQNISHNEAASIAAVATTVWYTLIRSKAIPQKADPPKRILIPAGAGGVGTVATQLCQLYGHEVVTTCATDAIPLLQDLGINNIIDYQSPTYEADLLAAGPYDVILGTLKEEEKHLKFFQKYLKNSIWSRYVSLQSSILADTDSHGLILGTGLASLKLVRDTAGQLVAGKGFYNWGFAGPDVKVLDNLHALLEEGRLKPVIDKVFHIDDALEAYKYMEDGHARGKTVISMVE